MTVVDYATIENAAEEAQVEIRVGYEGRGGRGGEGCLGIVFEGLPYLIEFVAVVCGEDADAREWIGNVRTDGMGRSTIAYWPHVTVNGAPDEDEDEGDDE